MKKQISAGSMIHDRTAKKPGAEIPFDRQCANAMNVYIQTVEQEKKQRDERFFKSNLLPNLRNDRSKEERTTKQIFAEIADESKSLRRRSNST